MNKKLWRARKTASGASAVLLAGCMLTALCLNPWTNIASGRVNLIAGSGLSATALENADEWDGDLIAAGWGENERNEEEYRESIEYIVSENSGSTTIEIGSAAALAYFAHEVYADTERKLDGATVTLTTDINLANHLWIPIGLGYRTNASGEDLTMFSGTFDGGEHTIYNLNADEFNGCLIFNEDGSDKDGWLYLAYSDEVEIPIPSYNERTIITEDVEELEDLLKELEELEADDEQPEDSQEPAQPQEPEEPEEELEAREEEVLIKIVDTHEYIYGLFGVTGNVTIKDLSIVNINISFGEQGTEIEKQIIKDEIVEEESETVGNTNPAVTQEAEVDGDPSADEDDDDDPEPNGDDETEPPARWIKRTIYTINFEHKLIANGVGAFIGYAMGNLTLEGCTAGSLEARLSQVPEDNDTINQVSCAGGLVGMVYAGLKGENPYGSLADEITAGTLNNGYTYGKVEFTDCTNYVNIGHSDDRDRKAGIVGYTDFAEELKFNDCKNYGNITGEYAGGITSYWQQNDADKYYSGKINYDWQFVNCINYGNITGSSSIGGIVGRGGIQTALTSDITFNLEISGCKNYGNVINTARLTDLDNISGITGGIIGYLYFKGDDVKFKNNFNYGTITGIIENTDESIVTSTGGLIGYLDLGDEISWSENKLSGGNYGMIVGCQLIDGCIGGTNLPDDYECDYLINAYKAEAYTPKDDTESSDTESGDTDNEEDKSNDEQ